MNEVIKVGTPEYDELVRRHGDLEEELNDYLAHAPGKEWWGKGAWDRYHGLRQEIRDIEKIIYPSGDES